MITEEYIKELTNTTFFKYLLAIYWHLLGSPAVITIGAILPTSASICGVGTWSSSFF